MKIRNRTIIRLASRMGAAAFRWLYWTCRIEVIEDIPLVAPYQQTGDARYFYCVWHDCILGAIFSGPQVNTSALTSRHADGEWVAEIIEAVGMKTIRGSSGQTGAAAVRQMMDAARELHIVIATDGPRGPRREVKQGIVFLASQSGRQIVPVATSAVKGYRPRGKWTDLLIPRPFTRVITIGGLPMSVPPNLSREQLEPYRQELQRRMDQLQQKADELAGQPDSRSLAQGSPAKSRAA